MPEHWIAIADKHGLHVLMLSRGAVKAIQRNLFVKFNGSMDLTVHRRKLSSGLTEAVLKHAGPNVALAGDTVGKFVDRIIATVVFVRSLEICSGAQYVDYKQFWMDDPHGDVDTNPYDETRYETTFRSENCEMLLEIQKWSCKECQKASERFRKRRPESEDVDPNLPNNQRTRKELLKKLEEQQRKIKNSKAQLERLRQRFQESLDSKGVYLDASLEDRLLDILKDSELTPVQQMFLHQQFKAGNLKDKRQMRWHPTLIRFALLVRSTSAAGYDSMKEAGLVTLPSERTLFDYSNIMPRREGCVKEKFDRIAKEVEKYPEEYKKMHTLIFDEIHISQKLVYVKSSGELIGYVKLNEVEEEMKNLCDFVTGKAKNEDRTIASKMLAFMVKGICTKVKDVCAVYTSAALTKEELFERAWEVIRNCELAGIKILALICDGSSTNRAFFQMHKPVTELPSGLVFDTVNVCAPERKLFFISDVPHLLKTLRNSFSKSGIHPKSKRKLTKGGQVIAWKIIERLFLEDHENTWRASYKLNPQNVYLNSYTCMKVSYAAQVCSNTVGMDLKERDWPDTSETIDFILRVNNWFDLMNGAHSLHGKITANPRLDPYTMLNKDERFAELRGFVQYFKEWEAEVMALPLPATLKSKMLPAKPTMEGIEVTVNGFIGAVEYMLDKEHGAGADFVNARTFCQDAVEQYFGKQRAALGGKHNPNVVEFLNTENKISVHRDFNVRRRSGNTLATNETMKLDDEKLQKRKRSSGASSLYPNFQENKEEFIKQKRARSSTPEDLL